MEILLENVRCLCDIGPIPIRPLTLLVGENSSGKTTFLAMVYHLAHHQFASFRPSFNVEPFDLGTYDSIATFKGGRYGRASSFSVGYTSDERRVRRKTVATYGSYRGQPLLRKFSHIADRDSVTVDIDPEISKAHVCLNKDGQELKYQLDVKQAVELSFPLNYFLQSSISNYTGTLTPEEKTKFPLPWFFQLTQTLFQGIGPALALAPVRTKPHRTYDEFSEEFQPQGEHVPIQLARLWQEENDATKLQVEKSLEDFGEEASLFTHIGVKRLGKRPSDPFQILVTTDGPPVNLPDVGYGVSQALPLIVQSVLTTDYRRLLLQQPEVHLHPRGQAALGSFFARLVAKEKKQFLIETHSDYLVDRVRLEVAQGRLSANDVLILFFEKNGIETRVHQLKIDASGNVLEAPPSYRKFFLDEEVKLLTRASR
jgi:energy-coupling factor transporter ATP-binding protein EcfA2